jgi:hypothetical protein
MVTDPGYQSLNARAVSGIYFSNQPNMMRHGGIGRGKNIAAA